MAGGRIWLITEPVQSLHKRLVFIQNIPILCCVAGRRVWLITEPIQSLHKQSIFIWNLPILCFTADEGMTNYWNGSAVSQPICLHTEYTNTLLFSWRRAWLITEPVQSLHKQLVFIQNIPILFAMRLGEGMIKYWTGSIASVTVSLHTEYTNTLCFAAGGGYDYITEPVHTLHKKLVFIQNTPIIFALLLGRVLLITELVQNTECVYC